MWKINGVELDELEVNDLAVAERIEQGIDMVARECSGIPDDAPRTAKIRTECNAIFDFFDILWGDGTAKNVFGGQTNLIAAATAYKDAIMLIQAKDKSDEAELLSAFKEAMPNRAARRAANKSQKTS